MLTGRIRQDLLAGAVYLVFCQSQTAALRYQPRQQTVSF
jgi:hypothetical protein